MEHLVTVLIVAVAAVVIVMVAKRLASHPFRCEHCSKEFRVKWTRIMITAHVGNQYKLVCPHCKTKGWCERQTKK